MTEFERIWSFRNLYKAHLSARLGKRDTKEVIQFELNLGSNLVMLSNAIRNKTYRISGYYRFQVHDPKERDIHALHYVDRVVQHCVCDEVLSVILEKKLIYDNAACRIGKGTHFALDRFNRFLHSFYREHGSDGYVLRCDIRKFFDNIDHDILKYKLMKVIEDNDVMDLLCMIINSFETTPGKGLPLGNQTSQWFAIYYLDGFDRLVKEQLHIAYYSRYMDDCVLIHHNREYLKHCLREMKEYAVEKLKLDFNEKTQIFPIRNGVDYLGWHFYLMDSGKVIKKVKRQTKKKYKRRLKEMSYAYAHDTMSLDDVDQVLASYRGHLSHGNTYRMQKHMLGLFVLRKSDWRSKKKRQDDV